MAQLEQEAARLSPADVKALAAKWDFTEDDLDKEKLYAELDSMLGKQNLKFTVGDRISGVVYKVDSRGAFVDIGAKAPAYLPIAEVAIIKPSKMTDVLNTGDELELQVIQKADRDGMMVLSIRKIEFQKLWTRFRELLAEDATVEGEIVSNNRGGTLVMVEGLRGFVPSSHMSPHNKSEDMVGKSVPLKFLEVDEERGRVVLSNRRALAEQKARDYAVGDVVEGVVTSVKPYGCFVDLGASNGLLHISQISHDRLSSVEDVFKSGDRLRVMILSQDSERGRISLSTKKLEPSPGDMLKQPELVYEKAHEMAAVFKERIKLAEDAARQEEQRLQAEGTAFGASDSEAAPADAE
jgi:small subunit ribosomal protein S1